MRFFKFTVLALSLLLVPLGAPAEAGNLQCRELLVAKSGTSAYVDHFIVNSLPETLKERIKALLRNGLRRGFQDTELAKKSLTSFLALAEPLQPVVSAPLHGSNGLTVQGIVVFSRQNGVLTVSIDNINLGGLRRGDSSKGYDSRFAKLIFAVFMATIELYEALEGQLREVRISALSIRNDQLNRFLDKLGFVKGADASTLTINLDQSN